MNDVKLTVIMASYNSAEYIAKAIESVIMQKVNFKYTLIIADDNSPDRETAEIIKEYANKYPDIIQTIFNKTNLRYYGNILQVKEKTKTPYFCLLDADDYYTDSGFLQRAYDFLEKNQEYVIYYENVNSLNADNSIIPFISKSVKSQGFDINDYINDRLPIVQTTGQFYRNVIFSKGIPQIMLDAKDTVSENSFNGDYDRFIMHLKYGKAYYNNAISGVYRFNTNGMWSKLKEYDKSIMHLQTYYDYNRYFENKYKTFFVNKMYNEMKHFNKCIGKEISQAEAINISDIQKTQLNTLYNYILENKNDVHIVDNDQPGVKQLIKMLIKRILIK